MADRFPSLEDFDSGVKTETHDSGLDHDTTAPDDFLARERALLGDDATQFAANDKSASFEDGDDDLLGGGDDSNAAYGDAHEDLDFQSSFPAIDAQNEQGDAPGGAITGSAYSTYQAPRDEEEPEPIAQWREKRNAQMQERAEKAEQKKQETIQAAQQNLDDFYENYENKKAKAIAQTRADAKNFLENRDDTTSGGTSWERIAKLIDLSGKGTKGGASGTGKERFRELLISLKKDEKAPGAAGV